MAHLIINRHFYGEDHGPPLEALCYTGKSSAGYRRDDVVYMQCWTPRIINDELYLMASMQLYHDKGRARPLRQHLDEAHSDEVSRMVCHHVGYRGTQPYWSGPQVNPLRELSREPGSADVFVPFQGRLKSCRYCFTDFRLGVEWHPPDSTGAKGRVVTVTRWHQLGSCRSPEDSKWYNYAADRYHSRGIRFRENDTRAGMVYRDWMTQGNKAAKLSKDASEEVAAAQFAPTWGVLFEALI